MQVVQQLTDEYKACESADYVSGCRTARRRAIGLIPGYYPICGPAMITASSHPCPAAPPCRLRRQGPEEGSEAVGWLHWLIGSSLGRTRGRPSSHLRVPVPRMRHTVDVVFAAAFIAYATVVADVNNTLGTL